MKISPEALSNFLAILPQYDRLSLTERRMLASIERPSQGCSPLLLGNTIQNLMAAGFVQEPVNRRCSIPTTRQEFIRTLRILRGHPIFQNPGASSFNGYVTEHFTATEKEAFRESDWARYGERNEMLFRQVTGFDWVERFMESNGSWRRADILPGTAAQPDDAEVVESTRKIVRWLIAKGGRATIRELPALTPTPELLPSALHLAFRNLLLFCAVDSATMEVQLGIWPGVLGDPALTAVPPPQTVTPTETFDSHFLMEDMVALLVACATEPILLRASDGDLYAKSINALARVLNPLPKWVEQAFDIGPEARIRTAVQYLYSFLLVEAVGYDPQHMTVTDRGREWLKLSAGDRLRVVVDGIFSRKQTVPAFRDFANAQISPITSRFHIGTRLKVPDVGNAMMQPFRTLEGDGFFPMQQIVAFSQMTNPLLEVHRKDKNAYITSDNMYMGRTDAESLQKAWGSAVHNFVRSRLFPLGAVRVGHQKDGISIAITPVGRYYLGQSTEWQWAAPTDSQVIVQPNFEVTFLGESPAAEAEIAGFAERRNQKMGALFQITKKSIFAAAVAGMTAESVLEVLDRVSTRPVPANVKREIQGWFAQCRKVSIEPAILIRCPDRETALRVAGVAKPFVTPVSDTVLEYRDPGGRQRVVMIKKLKELGMLVTIPEEKTRVFRGYHRERW